MTRRILSLALTFMMVFALFAGMGTVKATEIVDEGTCGENVTWTLTDDGVLTISGTGEMKDDDPPWYDCRDNIITVKIKNGVTSIGDWAFYDCTRLTSITIPSSVTSIGYNAFYYCTSLESVTIPSGVTHIYQYAFEDCTSLTSVTIPSGCIDIYPGAFADCSSLTAIHVASGNQDFCDVDGVLFCNEKTMLHTYPAGKKDENYTIPSYVVSIQDSAFSGCSYLKNVIIPDSVTSIGFWAFYGCTNFQSITIPKSVKSIGRGAFTNCTNLTKVSISEGVECIPTLAFDHCEALTEITIPESVKRIEGSAFSYCKSLRSAFIPSGVTYIERGVFHDCNSLKKIRVSSDNEYYCDVNGVLFSKDKSLLHTYPIGKTGTQYTIPSGVTIIEEYAFCDCRHLVDITIPESVTHIKYYAFNQCFYIDNIYYSGHETQWRTIIIEDGNDWLLNATIHYNSTGPEEDNNPIIIIPGIMGSRLFTSGTTFNDDTRLWDPVIDGLSTIGSIWDLRSVTGTVYVRPCEEQHQYADGGTSDRYGREYGAKNTYKNIVDTLCEAFPDREIYFFSYDWRKSNTESADRLNAFIQSLDAEKVDLLCHSMGGLVASSYYSNYGEGRLGKVITCGTPYEGAPKLLNSVMNWDVVGKGASPIEGDTWIDWALALIGGLTSDVKASFQGVVELTPSKNYVETIPMWKDSWIPFSLGDNEITYQDYTKICNQIFGEQNYLNARRFQQSLHTDNALNGYNALLEYDDSYFIIGINQPTITAVKFQYSNDDIDQLLYESDLQYNTGGDGTVPYFSASISEKVEDLEKDIRWFTYTANHNGTIKTNKCINRILAILGANVEAKPSDKTDKWKFTVLRFACPVDVTIEQDGEILSSAEENFSVSASFGRMDILGENDEIKMFCIFTDESTDLLVNGTGNGSMDMSIRYYDGSDELIQEYVFEDVPITADTVITADVGDSDEPVLSVDQDGDGSVDEVIQGKTGFLITFDINGGSGEIEDAVTDRNGKLTQLPEAQCPDGVFLGWFTAADGGEQVNEDTVFLEDTTLYAHWAAARPGDADGNGAVNTTDVILVRRYIAGGYNVTIDENAADVDGNGVINTTDVILMRRFIAGGYGVVLKPGKIA